MGYEAIARTGLPGSGATPWPERAAPAPASALGAERPDLRGFTVLQVLPALNTGGVERGTVDMVRAIQAAGGRALVASAGGRLVRAVEQAGGEHVILPLDSKRPWVMWLNELRLRWLLRRERVSLVHARSRAPAWSAWRAARRARVPFVTTYHGLYSEGGQAKRRYNSIMARGDRVIAVSHHVAEHLQARHEVEPDRVRVIHRGVDPGIFDPGTLLGARMMRLAERWRLPDEEKVVMLPGRLSRWKGGDVLVEAMAQLKRLDAVAVFVGGEDERNRVGRALLRQAERAGIAGRVLIVGDCDDMPAALALADVVVAPSTRPEAFGRTVIEAQAMGKPVIAADHGGAVETVEHGVTGWRVPPGDAEILARAIEYVLDQPNEERDAMGAYARWAVQTGFSNAAMQDATLRVYLELLRRG